MLILNWFHLFLRRHPAIPVFIAIFEETEPELYYIDGQVQVYHGYLAKKQEF
jgi:hypothetical protein